MSKSQLSSALSEVHRPTKRASRSSSTSSTSSKTLQRQEWEFVDEASYRPTSWMNTRKADMWQIPRIAELDRQRVQASVAPQSPLLPTSRQPSSLSIPPLPSSHSSRLNTPSVGSTESRKDLVQVRAQEDYKKQILTQGQGLKQELEETSIGSARSDDESSVESEEGSKQKIRGVRPIFKSAGDTESSEDESEGSEGATELGSTHSAHIMVGSAFQVRNTLRRNMLFYDDKEARAPGAALIAKARGILNKKRNSDWSEEKKLQVMEGIEDYRQELEATFVVNLMKHLHGDTRKVPQDRTLGDVDLQQEYHGIEATWKKDHLRLRYNVDFLTDCLPQIRTGDAYHDKLIEEVPRVENPKPDVAIGIYETAFSLLQREILNNQHYNLAGPQLYGVFFAIEAKCMNASIEEAENQCLRSGCAMVSTNRGLNQAACQARKATAAAAITSAPSSSSAPAMTNSLSTMVPKADLESLAFTLAVGSQSANMFVNWALEMDSDSSVQWHMHWLQGYSFRKPDDLNQLHHDMNNILDWGLSVRKDWVVDCCARIYDSGVIQPSRKRQKTDRRDKGPDMS